MLPCVGFSFKFDCAIVSDRLFVTFGLKSSETAEWGDSNFGLGRRILVEQIGHWDSSFEDNSFDYESPLRGLSDTV